MSISGSFQPVRGATLEQFNEEILHLKSKRVNRGPPYLYFTHFLPKNFELISNPWAKIPGKKLGILAHKSHRTREMGGGVKIMTGATGRGPPTMV